MGILNLSSRQSGLTTRGGQTYQVWGQPGLHETLAIKTGRKRIIQVRSAMGREPKQRKMKQLDP